MKRIILMVLRLLWKVPYYFYLIWKCGKDESITLDEAYARVKKVTKAANHAGRVKIEAYGLENIPREKTREIVKCRLGEIEKGQRDFRF